MRVAPKIVLTEEERVELTKLTASGLALYSILCLGMLIIGFVIVVMHIPVFWIEL